MISGAGNSRENEPQKNSPASAKGGGLLRVQPKTFVVDERGGQGLVLFETLKSKTEFTLYFNSGFDVELFIREAFNRQESGFLLSYKLCESLGFVPKKGHLKDIESQKGALLFLEQKEGDEKLKIEVGLVELLGLWALHNFPLYASKRFIADCRDMKIEEGGLSQALTMDLYKKYGQKYLM